MNTELTCLAWTTILGLAHILIAAHVRTKELGISWNMGARDTNSQAVSPLAGRLHRAQVNFFETFPLFAAAILLVSATQSFSIYSQFGAIAYLAARIIYLPIYALGIPLIRSLVWLVSMIGFLLILVPLFF